MAGYGFDVFTVACNTGTGTQALTGSCGGHTPKAAIVIVTGATTLGTAANHGQMSIGITDGTITASNQWTSEDAAAVANYNTERRSRANLGTITAISAGAIVTDGEFTFSSFSADTLTINITDAPTNAVLLEVILFFGDDLEVKCDSLSAAAVAGDSAMYSSLSFRPRAIFGLMSVATGTTTIHARGSVGVFTCDDDANGTKRQLSWCFTDRDTPTTLTRISQNVRNNAIAQRLLNLDAGGMTETVWYDITGQASNGFTLRTNNESLGGTLFFLAFRFGSGRVWCGFPAFATSSTATQQITEPGFRPSFVMAWGTAHTEANVNTLQNSSGDLVGTLTLGASDAVGSDRQASYQTEQGVGTGDTRCLVSSKLVEVVSDTGGTVWDATLASFDASGLSIDVGTASGNDKLMGLWVVEDYSVIASNTEEISDQVVLVSSATTAGFVNAPDTEEVSDQAVLLWAMVISDTEEILEGVQNPATGSLVISETEEIQDQDLAFLGNIIVTTDAEQITDEISTPLTVTASKAAPRGATFQGGAVAGWTYQGGAERGGTLSG